MHVNRGWRPSVCQVRTLDLPKVGADTRTLFVDLLPCVFTDTDRAGRVFGSGPLGGLSETPVQIR